MTNREEPIDDGTLPKRLSRRALLQSSAAAGVSLSALSVLAAACGGGGTAEPASADTTETPPAGAATSNAVEIEGDLTYLNGPFALPDEDKSWASWNARFTQQHPKIVVKNTWFDWATIDTSLQTAFAKSRPPDGVYLPDSPRVPLSWAGALLDLTERVKGDPDLFSAVPEEQWRGATYDGRILQVPLWGTGMAHVVNVSLMKQAGVSDWTSSWDAMLEATQAISGLGAKTFGFGMQETYQNFSQFIWLPLLWSGGGDLYQADGSAGALNTPQAAAAFDFLGQLYAGGSAPKAGLYDYFGLAALWQAGKLGVFAHSAGGAGIASQFPKGWDFEWDLMLWPPGPGGAEVSMASIGYTGVAAKTPYPDAAWEYTKYLASEELLVDWLPSLAGQAIPVDPTLVDDVLAAVPTSDTFESISSKWPPEFTQRVLDLSAQQADWFSTVGRPFPNYPSTVAVLQAVSKEVELVIRGQKTGAQAAADGNAAIDQLIAEG